jgi:hypothetical protein
MNGRSYFLGALYHTQGSFSHLPSFVAKFADDLHSLPFNRDQVHEFVIQTIKEYKQIHGPIDRQVALRLVMAEDLDKIERILSPSETSDRIQQEAHFEEQLVQCRDQAVAILYEFGLPIEPPEVFIVDSLPHPYDESGYAAIAPDEGDRVEYKIQPGLYFVKNLLRPFYSKFILLHELIHTFLGVKNPMLVGRGLEEGLAEVLGAMYLSNKILGVDLTTNLFVYNRLSYGFVQFWELYMDFTRQACYLYQRFGLDGLLQLMKEGRSKIKEVEKLCLTNQPHNIELPCGNWDDDLTHLTNYLTSGFGRNLVVGPLAKYLMSYIHPGRTTAEIIATAGVDMADGYEALQELEDRIAVVRYKDNGRVVSTSDCAFLKGTTRYEISEQ